MNLGQTPLRIYNAQMKNSTRKDLNLGEVLSGYISMILQIPSAYWFNLPKGYGFIFDGVTPEAYHLDEVR